MKDCKIEITKKLILGDHVPIFDIYAPNRDYRFKGRHIRTNLPQYSMVYFYVILFGYTNVLIGTGEDAFCYAAKDSPDLDLPIVESGFPIRIIGAYLGTIYDGMNRDEVFDFKVTIEGEVV